MLVPDYPTLPACWTGDKETKTPTAPSERTEQPGRRTVLVLADGLCDRFRQRQRVSYHGAVQSVLCHYRGTAPRLLRLTPLGAAVLEPHLSEGRVTLDGPPRGQSRVCQTSWNVACGVRWVAFNVC